MALTRFEEITVADLPESIQDYRRSRLVVDLDDPGQLPPLEEMERRYILRVLEAVHGHRTRAAEVLGLDRKTLYRKLERYGIREESRRTERRHFAPRGISPRSFGRRTPPFRARLWRADCVVRGACGPAPGSSPRTATSPPISSQKGS